VAFCKKKLKIIYNSLKKCKLYVVLVFCLFAKPVIAQSDCKIGIPVFSSTKIGKSCMIVLDTAFQMPQLNRTREVRIYLPSGYGQSKKHFPVIYMQDGEKIEDTVGLYPFYILHRMDSLYTLGKSQSIIVAIFSSSTHRDKEYNPFQEGEGSEYVKFIAFTLKPFIDKHFKTIPTKENTIIAGMEQGAVIALYATIKMPQVFGKAGIFSLDITNAALLKEMALTLSTSFNNKLFFYSNSNDKEVDQLQLEGIADIIGQQSSAMVYKMMDNLPGSNEAAWAKWFPEFTLWMNADGYNYVIKPW
jgi:predicted alpha/beta superfamily hydrolase